MTQFTSIKFAQYSKPTARSQVVFAGEELNFAAEAEGVMGSASETVARAAKTADFNGKKSAIMHLLAPQGMDAERLIVAGLGKIEELKDRDWVNLGGEVAGKLLALKAEDAEVTFPSAATAQQAADFAQGALLRGYKFDTYRTVKKEADGDKACSLTLKVQDAGAAELSWAEAEAVAQGTLLARRLVDEPANTLGPVEFAAKAQQLSELGVEVEILDEDKMQELGMNALLAVGQGSVRPSRLAVMKWNGGKEGEAPIAFVGKGVVFDTGGISLKPGAGMEDMKGDMGGAAAVIGLMKALAGRKAAVNAVCVLGLVENMPDGNAIRPGDIVKTMSGQTVEILNTDAEGRLVLGDALWYTQERFSPKFMIDLATLTGACMVALGGHRAGVFSEDDDLAAKICAAGETTAEKMWRLPLGDEYDKMIDTPNADMRNTGGNRWGGASTAAVYLQRHTNETKWAHIDIAGVAMGSKKTAISQGWASGFGVRALNRMIKEHFEG
ncbi:Cytosol aminopeptidase [Pseudovibrio axinellae]|uniref:Probable cytosol aminopeptidase n=1 Tax=Pseudovibrio axinellae TaxID=989403 RepID=A0A165ULA5_9HYPH|nr:leucyl aminopeptidase [Pseudovibrio axinellae]KZL12505.1 Cytosol aminopeptidase [Pseudovibrio axinellae]SEP69332.1 leucyl aminopeptidase [Pseudovibrio axinellae]